MILLDTDHVTVLAHPTDSRHGFLTARMQAASEQTFGIPIISAEEQLRGWLAEIRRRQNVRQQITAYERLAKLLKFLAEWELPGFDNRAADEFARLRKERIRIGTQDLKIASIALAQGALLLSANVRDFRQIPGLGVENWLK
jgi:tRNA(fMet)-specific endonuclease VapC